MDHRYERDATNDRRIGRGDDFAGDAYINLETMKQFWVTVGHDPNTCIECRHFESLEDQAVALPHPARSQPARSFSE